MMFKNLEKITQKLNISYEEIIYLHSDYLEGIDIDQNEVLKEWFSWLRKSQKNRNKILPLILRGDIHIIENWIFEDLAVLDFLNCEELIQLVLCKEAACAYDLRAAALEKAMKIDPKMTQILLREDKTKAREWKIKDIRSRVLTPTDGVDHLFRVPQYDDLIRLMNKTAQNANQLNIQSLKEKVLKQKNEKKPSARLTSSEVETILKKEISSEYMSVNDFWVQWNALVFGEKYTIAEILRIIHFTGLNKSPDLISRNAVRRFYRAVLKTFHQSVVGLGAGVFHVEHGLFAPDSVFFLGKAAILGKGLNIDGVGGFMALSGSFIGGGFSPILIHTHKHIKGENAKSERKKIFPCVFVAENSARFPMAFTGLFESADYINKKPPYEKIRVLEVMESI